MICIIYLNKQLKKKNWQELLFGQIHTMLKTWMKIKKNSHMDAISINTTIVLKFSGL